MTQSATKAITVFLTGATTWAGVNLAVAWATGFGVISATILAFLVPNTPVTGPEPERWDPPHRDVDLEAGAVEPGSLALGLLIGGLVIYLLFIR